MHNFLNYFIASRKSRIKNAQIGPKVKISYIISSMVRKMNMIAIDEYYFAIVNSSTIEQLLKSTKRKYSILALSIIQSD